MPRITSRPWGFQRRGGPPSRKDLHAASRAVQPWYPGERLLHRALASGFPLSDEEAVQVFAAASIWGEAFATFRDDAWRACYHPHRMSSRGQSVGSAPPARPARDPTGHVAANWRGTSRHEQCVTRTHDELERAAVERAARQEQCDRREERARQRRSWRSVGSAGFIAYFSGFTG